MHQGRVFVCDDDQRSRIGAMASAEDKFRMGQGGEWKDGTLWSPPGEPATGDDCFHQEQASDVLEFRGRGPTGGVPASLTVTPGGSPPRGFSVFPAFTFDVDGPFTKSGPGTYVVIVQDDATFRAGIVPFGPGAITGGDWTLGTNSLVEVNGARGINLLDGSWSVGTGAQMTSLGPIIGDTDNSGITLLGQGSTVLSGGNVQVAYITAHPGGFVSAGNNVFEAFREGVADGGTFFASTVYVGVDAGDRAAVLTLRNGGALGLAETSIGDTRVRNHGTLRYEGQGNALSTVEFFVQGVDGVVQKDPTSPNAIMELLFGITYSVQTDADHFWRWDASGVDLRRSVLREGVPTSEFEVTYGDFGGLFFVDVSCVPYASLLVEGPGVLRLQDLFPNAFHGSPPATNREALYVHGDITLWPNVELHLNGVNIYYTGALVGLPGQIIGPGNVFHVDALDYGDFDADCDVDLDDFAVFGAKYRGSGVPTDWPPADGDCDKDVDADDFAKFAANYTGAGPGCGGGEAASGGGGSDADSEEFAGNIQDLADWVWANLDAASRLAFADCLDAVVANGGAGDQAAQTAALAQLLR